MADKIGHLEVVDILRKVAKGEVVPRLKYPKNSWEEVYAGSVIYLLGGFEISIFNDCDSFDYIEYIMSVDGNRRGEFLDWFGAKDERGDEENLQPDDILEDEYFERMCSIFASAA